MILRPASDASDWNDSFVPSVSTGRFPGWSGNRWRIRWLVDSTSTEVGFQDWSWQVLADSALLFLESTAIPAPLRIISRQAVKLPSGRNSGPWSRPTKNSSITLLYWVISTYFRRHPLLLLDRP